jgi:phosphoribosyl-ATP pyrophosphohydrolase/phosphoribosyl-AMP cyclohydrolase
MVIASIDLRGGKAVQLRQGRETVLERDDPVSLIEDFDRYGEVAVIDLDAALGTGDNGATLRPLLRRGDCIVGGGIRTVEQAAELVSLGAKKIIVGSQAFRVDADDAGGEAGVTGFGINKNFLNTLAARIGRERIVAAVDAAGGEIVVDGWRTRTGLPLLETAGAMDGYAGGLLFTCVEREGTMTGVNLDTVRALREAVSCPITGAGGVSTVGDVAALAALGCDVQLGMALYTGKVGLADAFCASVDWDKCGGMIPVIAQSRDGQVLMTGYADKEAMRASFERGNLCFHSRTRGKLWMKGEHSGHTLKVVRMRADCDRDAILATVDAAGGVCHTGAYTCFTTDRNYTWQRLQGIIADRFSNPAPGSYTATLDDVLVRRKIMEEAYEVTTASTHDEVVWEAADLLYFTTALMTREDVTVQEVLSELERRHLR